MHVRALATLTLLLPSATLAGALAPKKPSDLVTVYTNAPFVDCPVSGTAFNTRVLRDGTQEPFVIPPKTSFVITSLSFIFQSNAQPNVYAAPSVTVQNGASVVPVLQGAGVTDASGNGSGTVTVPNGVAVSTLPAGAQLCITSGSSASGILHGFFVKDK